MACTLERGPHLGSREETQSLLESMGFLVVKDVQRLSLEFLCDKFGKYGSDLYILAASTTAPGREGESAKSISREHTSDVDSRNSEESKKKLWCLLRM